MNLRFLTEYIKDIRQVGAVAPSSRFLALRMVETIDFDRAKVIIEYGPGTGVFTAEIVRRMRPGTQLLVIETNQAFYTQLQTKYRGIDGVEIINASAERVGSLHSARTLPAPDYVVSGLPFAALPAEVSHKILRETVRLLAQDGEFITFQYTLLKRKLFGEYFGHIRTAYEPRNIPPAYVVRCRR